MKRFVVLALAAAVLLSGCEAYNNTNKAQRGAVIGAAAGGLLGAILGNNLGDGQNSELGAVLGTVVGGAAGAVIGNQMDKQAKKIEEEIPGAEVKRVDDGIVVTFDENSGVYFATAKHDINQKSKETLDKLVSILNEYPETNVLVAGYTDSVGKAEYNMGLSKRRAQAVTNYFTSKGLVASRFTTKWYGKENPVADNATPEGRAKNRRVNVIIVPNEKMKADAEKQANQK
nr:OmpA family protein [uncultured Capnocytophaga sp.]